MAASQHNVSVPTQYLQCRQKIEKSASCTLIETLLNKIIQKRLCGSEFVYLSGWTYVYTLLRVLNEDPIFGVEPYTYLPFISCSSNNYSPMDNNLKSVISKSTFRDIEKFQDTRKLIMLPRFPQIFYKLPASPVTDILSNANHSKYSLIIRTRTMNSWAMDMDSAEEFIKTCLLKIYYQNWLIYILWEEGTTGPRVFKCLIRILNFENFSPTTMPRFSAMMCHVKGDWKFYDLNYKFLYSFQRFFNEKMENHMNFYHTSNNSLHYSSLLPLREKEKVMRRTFTPKWTTIKVLNVLSKLSSQHVHLIIGIMENNERTRVNIDPLVTIALKNVVYSMNIPPPIYFRTSRQWLRRKYSVFYGKVESKIRKKLVKLFVLCTSS